MHISHTTVPASVRLASATAALPPSAIRGWRAWLDGVLAHRTERRQLLALGERDLRDIGLTPSEACALAQEPLWHR